MALLYIMSGSDQGRCFDLAENTTTIGRAIDNDIRLRDRFVSRKHLKIIQKSNKCFIKDLRSRNGTFVSGVPIAPGKRFEITEGCPVIIGGSVLSLGRRCKADIAGLLDSIHTGIGRGGRESEASEHGTAGESEENLQLIHDVANALVQALDAKQVLEKIMLNSLSLLKRIDRGVIVLVNSETGKITEIISRSRKSLAISGSESYCHDIVQRVLKEKEGLVVPLAESGRTDDLADTLNLHQIKSAMCVPLMSGGRLLGVIYVDSVTKPHGFSKEDLYLLSALSAPVALALKQQNSAGGPG